VLDAVAIDAGISKGGLLHHFPSKEALVGGLCDRMLERFEEEMTSAAASDSESLGSWTRAYLASTVTGEGKPADNSAQLMAGILATMGQDSVHLEKVRQHFVRWHARIASDGIDPITATLVRLAADGLWLSALLGLQRINPDSSADLLSELRDMTRPMR
jgi:AcrR family transcriptional regulator